MIEKTIVVIPTYNEKDNIKSIISTVLSKDDSIDVFIVDDNSPDGTCNVVENMKSSNRRIHILKREKKSGLGPAYLAGFEYIIKNIDNVKYIVEMDADFSHDPNKLPIFIKRMNDENLDLIVGSRYCGSGISVINWPLQRLFLSYYANVYARIMLSSKIKDLTGGFKCFRRDALAKMNFSHVLSKGYSFQIEMNNAFEKNGHKISEESIIFTERNCGLSKMSGNIIFEALFRVLRLRFRNQKKYFRL